MKISAWLLFVALVDEELVLAHYHCHSLGSHHLEDSHSTIRLSLMFVYDACSSSEGCVVLRTRFTQRALTFSMNPTLLLLSLLVKTTHFATLLKVVGECEILDVGTLCMCWSLES